MVKLIPGRWALRSTDQRPFEIVQDKMRPEVFHVGNDIYFDDGTPAAPSLFETPAIVMVMSEEQARVMGSRRYEISSGYGDER